MRICSPLCPRCDRHHYGLCEDLRVPALPRTAEDDLAELLADLVAIDSLPDEALEAPGWWELEGPRSRA